MPWSSLVLVTVLFSVICGNRLMDNRLLRSSSSSNMDDAPFRLHKNSDYELALPSVRNDNEIEIENKIKKFKDSSCSTALRNGEYDSLYSAPALRRCSENLLQKIFNTMPSYNMNKYEYNAAGVAENNKEDINEQSPLDTSIQAKNFNLENSSSEAIKDYDVTKLNPHLSALPVANYKDFYEDLVLTDRDKDPNNPTDDEGITKRNGMLTSSSLGNSPARGCDCKVRNDLVDLGQQHFPRYLLNAVCQRETLRNELSSKCWTGSFCRPLEYKVKVLTFRTLIDTMHKDPTLAWLPDDLRQIWKFKTVTVTAGCFCS